MGTAFSRVEPAGGNGQERADFNIAWRVGASRVGNSQRVPETGDDAAAVARQVVGEFLVLGLPLRR
jgi:hypothetical protein